SNRRAHDDGRGQGRHAVPGAALLVSLYHELRARGVLELGSPAEAVVNLGQEIRANTTREVEVAVIVPDAPKDVAAARAIDIDQPHGILAISGEGHVV